MGLKLNLANLAFEIFLCAVYAALVLLVTPPETAARLRTCRKENQWEKGRGKNFLLPLLSAFFLPWSGAPVFFFTGLGSRWWFAAICAAVLSSKPRSRSAALLRISCLACTGVTVFSLSRFMLAVGVPGALPDLESLAMILRLESLAGAKLFAAMAFFFTGLALAYAGSWKLRGEEPDFSRFSSVTAFSFSGFLSIVFIPFDATRFLGAPPWAAALINPACLFLFAVLLSRLLLRGVPLPPKARWLVPWAAWTCVAAGCFFLFCT